MGDPRGYGGGIGARVWRFADCVFDEANWTLIVSGRRTAIESKPLEILRQLLLQPGRVVSKADLLDSIWPGIAVVEASLPTAVHKLRTALGDDGRAAPIIETVPRIGYRLTASVDLVEGPAPTKARPMGGATGNTLWSPWYRAAAGAFFVALIIGILAYANDRRAAAQSPAQPTIAEVEKALRNLDVERIDQFLAAGWDAKSVMDSDGNTALNRLLNMCEWDPDHDRRRMLLLARTLLDGGTRLTDRNIHGDTAYSIAKAPRYCGANHPVTVMLHRQCYTGLGAKRVGDRCLATYELKRRQASSI